MPEAWQTFNDRLATPEGQKQLADWSQWGQQAYAWQRGMRDRYPVADAAVSFIPFVGAATAADDAGNALAQGNYGKAAWESLGAIPVGKALQMGGGLLGKLDSIMRAALLRNGHGHQLNAASDALEGAVAAGLSGATMGYGYDLAERQSQANKKGSKP